MTKAYITYLPLFGNLNSDESAGTRKDKVRTNTTALIIARLKYKLPQIEEHSVFIACRGNRHQLIPRGISQAGNQLKRIKGRNIKCIKIYFMLDISSSNYITRKTYVVVKTSENS